jgi:hypothetical protein
VVWPLRLWLGDSPADRQALEHAIAYARQSGNHRTQMQASGWLVMTFAALPIPADAATAGAEQLLQAASGNPWAEAEILAPLSQLYANAGRVRRRPGRGRPRSVRVWPIGGQARLGGNDIIACWSDRADRAGNPAAAERYLREGCQALRPMGERAFLGSALARLAEAVYRQGRLDEAQQLTEEAQSAAPADDYNGQARWRATRAQAARPPRPVPRRSPAGGRGGGTGPGSLPPSAAGRDTNGQGRGEPVRRGTPSGRGQPARRAPDL